MNIVPLLFAIAANVQTPPIMPQTPIVKVPPPVTLPAPPTQDQETRGAPHYLGEAVAIALRRQSDVAVAAANVQAAQGRTQQARSALNPQFGLNAGFTQQEQLRGGSSGGTSGGTGGTGGTGGSGGQPSRFSTSVNVNQLLFDFGRTRDEVRQQQALERATRLGLTRVQQDVALAARQNFFTYAEAVRLVEVAEANVQNRQRQLDLAQARLEQGLGAPGDVVWARTGLADAVLSLTTARNTASVARVQLAQTLGIDPRTPVNPTPTATLPAPEVGDVNALVETAIRQRPEVLEARERISAAQFGVSVARKTSAPSVGLNAGLAGRGPNDPFQSQTATLGVSVNWQFGDGGFSAGRQREARAVEEAARATLIGVSQQVVSDVSQAYLDLLNAEQRVATAEDQLANARELLRISEGRYAGGIGQFLEVTDAQASLFTAERNVVQSRNDVQRARARLTRALGG